MTGNSSMPGAPESATVVCLRWRGHGLAVDAAPDSERSAVSGSAAEYEALLRRVLPRCTSAGARIIAWHARSLAIEFPVSVTDRQPIDDAIRFVVAIGAELGDLGVGVAEGELERYVDEGERISLATGRGLDRATALAWIANPGEVLVDGAIEAVRDGRLLTQGAQVGTSGGQRVRGLRLDLRFPWRRATPASQLSRPPLLGIRSDGVEPPIGQLAMIVAPPGAGGTRMLDEIAERAGERVLRVSSLCLGEPLGGLRLAFAAAAHARDANLMPREQGSLDALLAAEGLDPDASAELVWAWFGGEPGWVLVDDADRVDADSLEAIAASASAGRVRVVARVSEELALPDALRALVCSAVVELSPLDEASSEELVRASTAGRMSDAAARRWAQRGAGSPLALMEGLRYSLEEGELLRDDDSVFPRDRLGGAEPGHLARHWISKRLVLLEPDERAVLDALTVLGGQAQASELGEFLEFVGLSIDQVRVLVTLTDGVWVKEEACGRISLSSYTLLELLDELLSPDRRASWQRAAFALVGGGERPLAIAAGAVRALFAGQASVAVSLARTASGAAMAAGLERTAQALRRFADTQDTDGLVLRGLTGGRLIPPLRSNSIQAPQPLEHRIEVVGMSLPADGPATGAVDALRRGDLGALARFAAQAREESAGDQVADRLEAMARLGRGDTGEALRLLRTAKQRAQQRGPAERCRAALAYGVGLAAAGRAGDALLEALEGLARAREASDLRGERACARFIARLTDSAGHPDPAGKWRRLAG